MTTLSPMNEPVAVAPRSVMDVVLFKYQALGNSYLILDPKRNPGWPRPIQPEPGWINAVCDADHGIGSNGLLIGPDRINGTEFEFRIINSDGSQAQLSGNGSRIFARYLLDAGYADASDAAGFSVVAISPYARVVVDVRMLVSDDPRIVTDIHIVPSFGPIAVALQPGSSRGRGLYYTIAALADIGCRNRQGDQAWGDSSLVSIGNPHCTTFVATIGLLPSVDLLERLRAELSFYCRCLAGWRQQAHFQAWVQFAMVLCRVPQSHSRANRRTRRGTDAGFGLECIGQPSL